MVSFESDSDTIVGNLNVETLKRQAKTLNLQKLLEPKMMPSYTET
jgi:hypothetical protein